ncbi:MAG: hypothetical protein AB7N80_03835 [Bdellovibrionales bacterium]
MIRQILLTVIFVSLQPNSAWGKAQQSLSTTQQFFNRLQVQPEELIPALDKYNGQSEADIRRNQDLEQKISLKLQEYGLREMTAKDHGVSQVDFRHYKARSAFAVLYYDVKVNRGPFGRVTFDLAVAKGSDFFVEGDTEIVHDCQALESRGAIRLNLEKCLRKYYEDNAGSQPQ